MKKLAVAIIMVSLLTSASHMHASYSEANSASQFKSLLANGKVVAMFGSSSCSHCKKMKPLFNQVSQAGNGTFVFVEVNNGSLADISNQYGIRGLPTFKVFKNGTAVASQVGEMSKSELQSFVNQ